MVRVWNIQHDPYFDDIHHKLNFYDFEVFADDWLVVIINPMEDKKTVVQNDCRGLRDYYGKHSDEIWIGYNSRNYDQFVLKGLLLGLDAKDVSDKLIMQGLKGFQIDERMNDIQLYNYDVEVRPNSLKQLEGFMGDDIEETAVDFFLTRKLTESELRLTRHYCTHDVKETIKVFKETRSDFDAQVMLVENFDLPFKYISKTKGQLTAEIVQCRRNEEDRNDEFEIDFVPTLKLKKYRYVYDWFCNPENMDYTKSLVTNVCGIPHQFGWGGLHGCIDGTYHAKGRLFHWDVTSFYPSLMIVYDFLSRNSQDKNTFKEVYDTRVALKKAGKKKEQAPLKIVLNSQYGITKDVNSKAYDPRQANNICVNGQLLLLDLLEKLEGKCKVVQTNTDAVIIEMIKDNYDELAAIKQEWCERTKMGLGDDRITEILQSDVNNYITDMTRLVDVDMLECELKKVSDSVVRNGKYKFYC